MAGTGPPKAAGPKRRGQALWLAALVVLPALVAGCIAEPTSQATLRRGDLVRAELVVADETGVVLPGGSPAEGARGLCGQPLGPNLSGCPQAEAVYVLSPEPPLTSPPGWSNATPLPDGLVDALSGLAEDQTRFLEDVQAWGPHRESLVRTHPLEANLSRVVDRPDGYGHDWRTRPGSNGTHVIQPRSEDRGALLEDPDWCNARFCLFESELAGWNDTHLHVHHRPQAGAVADVEELSTRLEIADVSETSFRVDGNPARAGERYDVFVRVLELRGPPEGTRRAPDFTLATVDGREISLAEHLGRPVVIEFFATWCPSCIENTDHLSRLQERFGDEITILAIDVDPWEKAPAIESFIRQNGVTWPIAVDERGEVGQAYRVGSLSTEVIVSPQGVIVHTETGVADHERVVRVLEQLTADAPSGPDAPPGEATAGSEAAG